MGTPAIGFYSLHHGVDGYVRGEELVALLGGEEIDGSVSRNKETWINKQSKLGDMVSWFLVLYSSISRMFEGCVGRNLPIPQIGGGLVQRHVQ